MTQYQADTATSLLEINHVALRVVDPDAMAGFLCAHCGMRRAEPREGFVVLEPVGGRTRLFLSWAEEPPERGVLQRLVLRVADLQRAVSLLPNGLDVRRVEADLAVFQASDGLELGLASVLGGGIDYDLDHLLLRVMDPDETAIALAELGFVLRGGALHVADKQVRLEAGGRSAGERERELLSHIGVRVESVEAVHGQALLVGLEVDQRTLPPSKLGIYVRGPERLRVEYTDHDGAALRATTL